MPFNGGQIFMAMQERQKRLPSLEDLVADGSKCTLGEMGRLGMSHPWGSC